MIGVGGVEDFNDVGYIGVCRQVAPFKHQSTTITRCCDQLLLVTIVIHRDVILRLGWDSGWIGIESKQVWKKDWEMNDDG